MSKIYKALEKAQRERDSEGKPGPISLAHFEEAEKRAQRPEEPAPLKVGGTVAAQQLVSYYDAGSLAAEQFRKLRTQLLRLQLPRPPRTILVTSATAAEGKTLVAANLAAGIAHDLHAHSLLVDCDLRSPSLGNFFGVSGAYGLADYLVGRREIPELLIKTEVDKLKLLVGGTIQDNPTELIGSPKMEALIQELKTRYSDRYIILDSTPLLSTSEPEVLSKQVDGILVVVRAGVTPRETVKQAISSLEKEKILGFVLNDLQFQASGLYNRYFGADDGSYGYGYGKKRKAARGK